MISKILELDIKDVVDKLWLKSRPKGHGEFGLIENWKKTDGWTYNVNKNIVTDFSKSRGQWPSFQFVKSYLRLDDGETYERFANNFGLVEENWKKDVYELPECSSQQIEY